MVGIMHYIEPDTGQCKTEQATERDDCPYLQRKEYYKRIENGSYQEKNSCFYIESAIACSLYAFAGKIIIGCFFQRLKEYRVFIIEDYFRQRS